MAQDVLRFQSCPVTRIAPIALRFLFPEFFLAQTGSGQLDIGKQGKRVPMHPQKRHKEAKMTFSRVRIACVLVLCLGLAISSISVLAQKSSPAATEKINLNSATVEQLQSLPGIGPATAKSIVDYRTKVGKFNRIEEIINVKGIGEKKFQKIKDRLVL
jgi:comEA protein